MPTLISCHLDASTAVRLGLASAGDHYVALTEDALGALTAAERELLAPYAVSAPSTNQHQRRLSLAAPPTAEGVIASLRREIARDEERKRQDTEEHEERIRRALAQPDAEWIGEANSGDAWFSTVAGDGYSQSASGVRHGRPIVRTEPAGSYLPGEAGADPRITVRRKEVERRALPAAISEWERHFAAWRVVVEQAKRVREEARAAELSEAERWISGHGSARLRKIVAAGLLGSSLTAYHDERLEAERPGWVWDTEEYDLVRNPSEEALDALSEVRRVDPAVRLRYDRSERRAILVSEYLGSGISRYAEGGEGEDEE